MNLDCSGFRAALEAELAGRPAEGKLAWLSWNEHLLTCADCRELLEKEEALEALLASLPDPRLPAPVLRRVLARLRRERAEEVRLEGLLDAIGGGVRVPEGLAAGVLAKLADERRDPAEAKLDALLEVDRFIPAPEGMSARVLAALASARRAPLRRPVASRPIPWLWAAAAGIAILVGGRFVWIRAHTVEPAPIATVHDAPPDPALLASLDVVEHWDELVQGDVDVLLSTLGPADEALLDYR